MAKCDLYERPLNKIDKTQHQIDLDILYFMQHRVWVNYRGRKDIQNKQMMERFTKTFG